MKKVILFAVIIVIAIGSFIMGASYVGVAKAKSTDSTNNNLYKNLSLFTKVLNIIEATYVEKVKSHKLVYGAIEGMLSSLDPHSNFLDPKSYKEMKESTTGKFAGIGIEITKKESYLTVITPIEGSPASAVGLKPMDKIIKINDKSALNISLNEAVKRIRGKRGTKVKLGILRQGSKKPLTFYIRRETIKVIAVKSTVLPNNFAYIKLSTFSQRAVRDLKDAITKIKRKTNNNIAGILFDLRLNPGGLLDQAVAVSNIFIDKGPIVSVKYRDKNKKLTEYATEKGTIKDIPIVVLVNEGSASASEIVAGALKDHKRALIVGQKTFGKGSVQTLMELGDGSAIKYTIARYYTPNGTSIQATGIEPDIKIMTVDPKVLEAEKLIEMDLEKSHGEANLKGHFKNENDNDDKLSKIYSNIREGMNKKIKTRNLSKVIDLDYDYQAKIAFDILQAYSKGKNLTRIKIK